MTFPHAYSTATSFQVSGKESHGLEVGKKQRGYLMKCMFSHIRRRQNVGCFSNFSQGIILRKTLHDMVNKARHIHHLSLLAENKCNNVFHRNGSLCFSVNTNGVTTVFFVKIQRKWTSKMLFYAPLDMQGALFLVCSHRLRSVSLLISSTTTADKT